MILWSEDPASTPSWSSAPGIRMVAANFSRVSIFSWQSGQTVVFEQSSHTPCLHGFSNSDDILYLQYTHSAWCLVPPRKICATDLTLARGDDDEKGAVGKCSS